MESVDQFGRARAQGHMRAAVRRRRLRVSAQIDPELGILLAETDGGGTFFERRHAERAAHGYVEARRGGEIAHGDRDVVDHDIRLIPEHSTKPTRTRSNPSA